MSSRRGVRVLFYAINGQGLGHLSRLVAIARATRDILHALDLRAELQILTTSEAPEVVVDFPVYKLPSKTMAAASDLDSREFIASARLMISTLVAGFRPDVLVTDTVAEGSFQEFAWIRSYAAATVFIDRHKDRRVSTSEVHLRHLELYDRVLVPDEIERAERYPAPASVRGRRRFLGAVHGFRPELGLGGAEVRARFNVSDQRRLIYVSAGGGGAARDELELMVEALRADPRNHLLVGYGPLDRGQRCYAENVTPLTEPELWRYFPGVDGAICAAGYNTYEELLAARVPTVFYAQPKGLDRQDLRVAHGRARGYHLALGEGYSTLETLDPQVIQARVDELFDAETRRHLEDRLAERPPAEGALQGAVEILALHASLPGSPLRRERLYGTAALRAIEAPEVAAVGFPEAVRWLEAWRDAALTRAARDEARERLARRWHEGLNGARARGELAWGAELARRVRESALGDEAWLDLLKAYGAASPARDEAEDERSRARLRDTLAVLDELAQTAGGPTTGEILAQLRAGVRRADLADVLHRWTAWLDREESIPKDTLLLELLEQSSTKLSLFEVEQLLDETPRSE